MSLIQVEHLKYRYPHTKKLALDDVSFSIEQGEFIGVIGGNGSGKSTLSQALVGLVPQFYIGAYGGKVLIDGMDASTTPIAKLCQKAGLVFQNPFNQLSGSKDTVYEEIGFGLQNLGIEREEMHRRIKEAMELLDISQYRDRNPFDLSGGQMQRAALASILVMKPEIIILDEPTSQLDPMGSEEVFRAVEQLTQSGITVIMIEHKMEKIAAYCNRVMLLNDGKLVDFDTPERIFARDDLLELGVKPPVTVEVCKALKIQHADGTYPVTPKQVIPYKQLMKERLQIAKEEPVEIEKQQEYFQLMDVSFSYHTEVPIIEKLNCVLDGRTTAIVGQNGAGKTTTVKLLKGLLKPISGTIWYQRENLSEKTVAMLAGRIGYVFQNPDDQIFKYNVLDEVMFGPLNIGMSRKEAKEHALKAMEIVGLRGIEAVNPYDLDLSRRKLVAIASVLAMDTDVVILDEPTIAQDEHGKSVIRKVIAKLRASGKCVIAILHDMELVAESFERMIVMAHGRIIGDGSPAEVFKRADVIDEACLKIPMAASLCQTLDLDEFIITTEGFLRKA